MGPIQICYCKFFTVTNYHVALKPTPHLARVADLLNNFPAYAVSLATFLFLFNLEGPMEKVDGFD